MAETWNVAFGRYLRALRERRQLSLQSVSSLSQAFAETVNKGYLSRCENGRQRLAFSKIIPLGRIYGVPADVLLERLELDLELDRIGSPNTEGMDFDALRSAGRVAMDDGFSWRAYAFCRDSIVASTSERLGSRYETKEEQNACAQMNCGTAAYRLGRHRFALHEYAFVESTNALGIKLQPLLLHGLSLCYRVRKEMDRAVEYADKATSAAEATGDPYHLGLTLSNSAQLALARAELERAAKLFQSANQMYERAECLAGSVQCLNNIAQIYFDLGRLRASRRMLLAAESIARDSPQRRAQALGRILMGEIDAVENKHELAAIHWKEAAGIARELDDKVVRFKAEFFLFKQAKERGNSPAARSLQRRLLRLANWIPSDTPELGLFYKIQ